MCIRDSAYDVKSMDANVQYLLLRGENSDHGTWDSLKTKRPHHHKDSGEDHSVFRNLLAASIVLLGVCIAQQRDNTGLQPSQGNEKERLKLVVKSQHCDGLVREAGQNDIERHDIDLSLIHIFLPIKYEMNMKWKNFFHFYFPGSGKCNVKALPAPVRLSSVIRPP